MSEPLCEAGWLVGSTQHDQAARPGAKRRSSQSNPKDETPQRVSDNRVGLGLGRKFLELAPHASTHRVEKLQRCQVSRERHPVAVFPEMARKWGERERRARHTVHEKEVHDADAP